MSIFLIILTAALCLTILWAGAKFFGKLGLFCVTLIMFMLVPVFNLIDSASSFLGGYVDICLIFTATGLFALTYTFTRLGLSQTVKLATVIVGATFLTALLQFIVYLFAGATFGFAFQHAILDWLFIVAGVVAACVVGFIFDRKVNLDRLQPDFRNFIIFGIMLVVNNFVYCLFSGIGEFAFGQILLNILIGIFISILYAGIMIIFSKLCFDVDENPALDALIKQKITKEKPKFGIEEKNDDDDLDFYDEDEDK